MANPIDTSHVGRARRRSDVVEFKLPNAFWRGVERLGITPESLLRHANLPSAVHPGHEGEFQRVTVPEFFALWRAVEVLTTDAAAGIRLATDASTAMLPLSSLVAFWARDYRDGLCRYVRFKQLCAPEHLFLTENKDGCTVAVDWGQPPGVVSPLLIDASFASLLELGRQASGSHIVPRRVELSRSDSGSGQHAGYFGCAVHYRASRDALVLDAADLDRPFLSHNVELVDMATPILGQALAAATHAGSTAERVKLALKRALASGRPDVSSVARDLGASERTLQRRIAEEGTSFRTLLLEARQELARHRLSNPAIDLGEIAYMLGYGDLNSFFRAFRSWEGSTPTRWREQHRPALGRAVGPGGAAPLDGR